jgi:hypothetical protein
MAVPTRVFANPCPYLPEPLTGAKRCHALVEPQWQAILEPFGRATKPLGSAWEAARSKISCRVEQAAPSPQASRRHSVLATSLNTSSSSMPLLIEKLSHVVSFGECRMVGWEAGIPHPYLG